MSVEASTPSKNEQQCLPIHGSYIDRICSKTCRVQKNPFEKIEPIHQILFDSYYFPFCSNRTLNHSINQTNLFNELTEKQCRDIFNDLITSDERARNASKVFAIYMHSIDSASDENRYSIIKSDCHQAYQTWTCSVNIPYYHRNRRILPCQTICDEVERVCPTFRPSDHEPLFAGQPLFFCNGGIVTNSNYGQRPHCFDTCHLADSLFERHSNLSSIKTDQDRVTKPLCFEIESLSPSLSEQNILSFNDSIYNSTSNLTMSASAISIISSSWSSIIVNILTFIFVLLLNIFQT